MMWYRYPVHTVSVAARSHLAYFFASSHQLPACLPSFRSSSRRTGRIVVSPVRLPALRHGWAGREAGSVGALCLLGFALRSVPMSIGRFMLYLPAMSPRSACLSARLRGRWRSHLIRHLVRAGCVAVSCLPVGSSRLSPCSSSRRSGRFCVSLAPSCDTMGGEED